ncbi:conserved hypothetical protein [Methanococcus vannielii SB]|uniref:Polysaccharide deacetylase n=1 Tax=Methanococcus vannielii (strain ATCC 35089 / DSM 1224 / JCM 13029 / OCM 148 / SB) TaxID=406327 RepID=A6UPS9_METVS|nr:DUF2334 domain-containing protein [Methanococcus vannielii]ABR54501.1 conserved hypothetical protein [Methanococcus vannielii SB]
MKIVRLLFLSLFLAIGIFSSINYEKTAENVTSNGINDPVILIHDVSPIYFEELKEIDEILSKNGYSSRTYLFVIVNHGNTNDISKNADFIAYLLYLKTKGYIIELHGYDHIGQEFNCNASIAAEKLDKSLSILENHTGRKISYIMPPRYGLSDEAKSKIFEKNLSIVIGSYYLEKDFHEIKVIKIENKEYTWYLEKENVENQLLNAKNEYINSKNPYFLSIHPKAVNYGGGIEFLDKFLSFTKKKAILNELPENTILYKHIKHNHEINDY